MLASHSVDTAPMHGDGKGEEQLGQAIADRRVLVLTGDDERLPPRATART